MTAQDYQNLLPYARLADNPDAWKAYRQEEQRLADCFYRDLAAHLGLTGHPKYDLLFSMAWERGHSAGHSEVISEAESLAELLR